jgi:hypothetical protein
MSVNYDVLKQIPTEFPTLRTRSIIEEAEEPAAPTPWTGPTQTDEMLHVVNQVFFTSAHNAPQMVAFSGIEDESMSWSICARTARVLAQQSSRSVCVIDGNIQSRKLTKFYSEHRDPAMEWRREAFRDKCIPIGSNLWQADAGLITGGGVGMLPLNDLQARIATLRQMFYYVLIDTPGLNGSERASVLTQIAGAVILVIEANVTRRRDAGKAAQVLRAGGVRLLGTILNNRHCPVPQGLYSKL